LNTNTITSRLSSVFSSRHNSISIIRQGKFNDEIDFANMENTDYENGIKMPFMNKAVVQMHYKKPNLTVNIKNKPETITVKVS